MKSVDGYISQFPGDIQETLEKIREIIKEEAPEAKETISYQMPAFRVNGKALVYFAAWKDHIGLYPLPSGIKAFKKQLAKYNQAKGSVQFPIKKVPYNLIKKIVKFRAKENYGKKKN